MEFLHNGLEVHLQSRLWHEYMTVGSQWAMPGLAMCLGLTLGFAIA